jgi:hypothetical protein
MSYIVQRQNRFYVVVYDGVDPTTSRERRRWHPAGYSRLDAEAIARRFEVAKRPTESPDSQQVTVGQYLTEKWMPGRRRRLQETTAHRYEWMIANYIEPALGSMPLRSLRAEHLDRFYTDLLTTGGERASGLAPKTVYDVHVIIRAALGTAQRQRRPRSPTATTPKPRTLRA